MPAPPPSGGSGYAIGAVVLGIGAALLLYMKCSADESKPTPTPTAPTTAAPKPTPKKLPEFSPPPPPEEEEDAGVSDAGKKVVAAGTRKGGKPKGDGGACSGCGKGEATGALTSKVSSTAGTARGCYQRALRGGGGEGRIVVSVSIGANGNLCSAGIASDSLGNPGVAACVLSKFRSASYPKPKQGCVVINVPINFKMKTP